MKSETNKLLKQIITRLDNIVCVIGKRKKGTGKRGKGRGKKDREGRRGPQTAFMAKQRKVFLEYLKVHLETASVSRITRARECWAIHRKEWNAAAKKGIGYADYKGLARSNLI